MVCSDPKLKDPRDGCASLPISSTWSGEFIPTVREVLAYRACFMEIYIPCNDHSISSYIHLRFDLSLFSCRLFFSSFQVESTRPIAGKGIL